MNAEQKRAWLVVYSAAASLIGYTVLLPIFGPVVALAAFSCFGINGFAPLIGRAEKSDERDTSIARRATLAGAMASYMAFVLGCMGVWFYIYAFLRQEHISVHVLGMITILGGCVLYLVRALAILMLYRHHVEADHA